MRWQIKGTNPVSQDILTALLQLRGFDLATFTKSPNAKAFIPYQELHNTVAAAKVIADFIKQGRKIAVHGDYDVDGVCATSILWQFLYRQAQAQVIPFIPSRFDSGYGLTPSSIKSLQEQGIELIITVDCGIRDVDLIKEYTEAGITFVVSDHHQLAVNEAGEKLLPPAAAVAHPLYPGHEYAQTEICGTTVAWKLVQALAAELNIAYDPLADIDLVALATSCDMMPLIGENRTIVQLGLHKLSTRPNLGLQKLYEVAGIKHQQAAAYHLGFVLGPRLNAAGRLESAMTALRLLCTQNPAQALQLAKELDGLNKQRQDLTQSYIELADGIIQQSPNAPIYFVYGEEWPEGILGLIAGKLTERYQRPVLAASVMADKVVGSARSTESLHITNLLSELQTLLVRFGGHAQAAGFTLLPENIAEFNQQLVERAAVSLSGKDLTPILNIDLELDHPALTIAGINELLALEPHGLANPKPVFAIKGLTLTGKRVFGRQNEHIAWRVNEIPELELVGFGKAQDFVAAKFNDKVNVAVQLSVQSWQAQQTIQGIIKDIQNYE
jgi:single-stranded-DNA-specific exonuclease